MSKKNAISTNFKIQIFNKKILDNKLCFTVMMKDVQEVNNFVTTITNYVHTIIKFT